LRHSFPFKGKAGMGMGKEMRFDPTLLPLQGKGGDGDGVRLHREPR